MERSWNRKQRPVQPPVRREARPKARLRETRPGTLPQFLKPCKVLIRNMKPIIQEKAEKSEKKLLIDLIRSQLRKTIALLLENKDYMPSVLIVKLYREKYPKSTDEEVVVRNLLQLRASHWPVSNPGYAKAQTMNDVGKKKTNTEPPAKSEKPGSSTIPVANIKQQDSKTQEDRKVKVQEGSAVKEVPKEQAKNDHNLTDSTVDLQLMESADDDWIDYGVDNDENSQESSSDQE